MTTIKKPLRFKQLCEFKGSLYGIDLYGRVWIYHENDYTWSMLEEQIEIFEFDPIAEPQTKSYGTLEYRRNG